MTENVAAVTDETFEEEVLNSDIPVMVDFWADWCGPCKMMAPVIDEIAQDYAGRVKVVKLDVDANPNTAAQFGIRSIPTSLFFKDGKVADQLVGVAPKAHIASRLDRLLTEKEEND